VTRAARRVRIVGVGSGAVGLAVAEHLGDLLAARGAGAPRYLSVVRCERPFPDLLDALGGVDGVVLVDATRGGGSPGTVRRIAPAEIEQDRAASSHGFGAARALALAVALGRAPGPVAWVGVEVGRCAPGAPLSAPVRRAVPAAAALALALAAELAEGRNARPADGPAAGPRPPAWAPERGVAVASHGEES
jgi:hydrogenase maturation protease